MDLTPAFADKSELYKSVSSDSAKCTKPIGKTFNLSRAAMPNIVQKQHKSLTG